VAFYTSPQFRSSPSGFFVFDFSASQIADVGAFLRVINAGENLRQVRKRVEFVRRTRSSGNTDLLTLAIADTRDAIEALAQKSLNPRARTILEDVKKTLSIAQ
jgi:hypothetical protein